MNSTKNNLYCQKLPNRFYQTCPLCGESHPAMMRGKVQDMETGEFALIVNKGYSFCNCHNIFYTDWSNIEQKTYDESYYAKYQCEDTKKLALSEVAMMYPVFEKFAPNAKKFFEIGSIHDYILADMQTRGYQVSGIDITPHESQHNVIIQDFEDYWLLKDKHDIIWASHVFEHFKEPLKQLDKCKEILSDNGLLYIAMPDTFFIDFEHKDVMHWDWVITEHHIMWGMDSFINVAEQHGFKCLWSNRNSELNQKPNGDWFWKQDFKVVLTHA